MESIQQAASSQTGHYFVELENNLSAKIEFLAEFLEANYGKKIGVFCPFPSDVDLLETVLRKKSLIMAKLIGHVSFAKVASVFEQLNRGEIVGVLLTDVSSKHVDLSQFDFLVIFSPSADPSIYYQRSGLATGTTPKFGVVSLVSTQDLVNFQYLRKASNLQFEVYSTIKGDVTENRKRILESVLTKFVSQFETSQQLDERMNDYVSKLRSDRELLERSVPLLLDVFLRHIPSETDRSADSKENLPRKSVKVSVKEARIFVNLGSNHEFSESALKALLDQAIEGGAQHLIRVSIRKNYSFFDVVDFVSDELLEKLNGISWNGNKVGVRLAVRLNPLKSEVGKEG